MRKAELILEISVNAGMGLPRGFRAALGQRIEMARLTKRAVDAAKVTGKDYFLWDDEMPGFGLRVLASGRKSYVVQYKVGGRGGQTRRKSLGLHGVLTPEEARIEAKKWLADRAKGKDPIAEHAANRKAETVEQLCRSYIAAAEQGLILGKKNLPKKASTLATDRGRIERHIVPLLGRKRVKEVTPADVTRFMRDVIAGKTAADVKTGFRGRAIVEGGAGTAARTVGLLGGIFSYAVSEGLRADNPVRGVKRPADRRRDRRLSPEDYRALAEALADAEAEGENLAAIIAVRLLALTGARLGEIANLRLGEIDRQGRALRLADSKEGASVRPLGTAALAVLDATSTSLRREGCTYVLPAKAGDRAYGGLSKAISRITARRAEVDGVTAHVLRHSFASIADELGYTEATVAALLGQRSGSVTRRYIHHLDRALIAAADRVSAYISAAMTASDGTIGKVITLHSRGG
jgi:integrase